MPRDIYKEIKYKSYTIKIFYDTDPGSPRNWDNLGTMVCFHRRYSLGDSHSFGDPDDFRQYVADNNPIVLPLYLYDHSGITMSTGSFGDRWDSGQVGWIYVDRDKVREEYGWKNLTAKRVAKIEEHLKIEVKVYDMYLTGEVYGFEVEDEDESMIDSCWGFFGDEGIEQLTEECRQLIDSDIQDKIQERANQLKNQISKHAAQVKQWIKNRVPHQYRKPLELS